MSNELGFPSGDLNAPAKTGKKVFELFKRRLVHVAVLCPPGSALTMLLNAMSDHDAIFTMSTLMPVETGRIAHGGQVQVLTVMIFAMEQATFEEWLGVKYEQSGAYPMENFLQNAGRKAH